MKPCDLSGRRYVLATLWQHPSAKWIVEGLQRRGAEVVGKDALLEKLQSSLSPQEKYTAIILPSAEKRQDNEWLATLLKCPMLSELDVGQDISPCPIIAVTGTNGKTSTSEMIALGLRAAGKKVETFVNFEDSICNLKDPKTDYAVVECWSSQIESSILFAPEIAVFLNLEPNHLDYHPDFNAYAQAKSQIFARQQSTHTLIYNSTSPALVDAIARIAPKDSKRLDFTSLRNDRHLSGADALGNHMFDNCCAAYAVAIALGLSEPQRKLFAEALRQFKPRAHRQQTIAVKNGITYVNDSKSTTPHSLRAAVERFSKSQPLVLLTGGTDKNLPLEETVLFLRDKINGLVILGSFPRLEKALHEQQIDFEKQPDFSQALTAARQKLPQGGVVLFSPLGASDDLFADYEERGALFIKAVEAL